MKILLLILICGALATEQVADYYSNIHMKHAQVWPQRYRKQYQDCVSAAKEKYQGLSTDDTNYQNARTNCRSAYNRAMTGHGVV